MQQTNNYGLNQWEMTDLIKMEDFNGDNSKVDAALAAQAAILAQCGNCKIETGSYVGTGRYGSSAEDRNSLTFSGQPLIVIIGCPVGAFLMMIRDSQYGLYVTHTSPGMDMPVLDWSEENKVSWYHGSNATHQANTGMTYHYIALIAADN